MPVLIQSMSEKLFDISAKKLTFRCKEDEIFFEDQKKDRKFAIGCIDVKDNIRIKRTQEGKERDIKKLITLKTFAIQDSQKKLVTMNHQASAILLGPLLHFHSVR